MEYKDWEVIGTKYKKGKVFHIPCRCRCGKEQDVNYYNLINGKSRSCRACALRERNKLSSEAMIGNSYGRWLVIDNDLAKASNVWCLCSCGDKHSVSKTDLTDGKSTKCRSCGATKHGMSRSPLYTSWAAMIGRMKHTAAQYKADTASMRHNELWLDYIEFAEDMEATWEEGLQLHRKDNSKGYYKDNCVWLTPAQHNEAHGRYYDGRYDN